jgi:hemolysin activation/secretion protein
MMSRHEPFKISPWLLAAVTLCASQMLTAQTAPDAGQIQQSVQPPELPAPPSQSLPLSLPDEDELSAPQEAGIALPVRGFVIEGNSVISTDELLALLADLEGRSVALSELQGAVTRLTRLYRQRGYLLARAYIPAQEIADGVIRIGILEGHYGDVQVERQDVRASGAALAPLRVLQKGEVIEAAELTRSLLLLQDVPGQLVNSTLKPGQAVGSSDLVVQVRPGPRLSGGILADNYGNRFTGALRAAGYLNVNSPLGLGDRLALQLLGSEEDQHYYRLAYDVPINRWGTRVGAGYSYMSYELGETFKDLEAEGSSRVASLFARHPLVVSRDWRVSTSLRYDNKRLSDEVNLYDSVSRKRSNVLSLGLDGSGRDTWLGGGVSQFSTEWSNGRLSLRSAEDRQLDALSAGTNGHFNSLHATLARLQKLVGRWSLYGRLQGQYADGNLDSSEKMGLGGAYGVRAYPQGEAVGDQGWLGTLELRYALTPQWQLQAFVDHGEMRLNKERWDDGDNNRSLSAAGFGSNWSTGAWQLGAVLAWKVGGEDPQSDRDRTPRMWAQGGWRF